LLYDIPEYSEVKNLKYQPFPWEVVQQVRSKSVCYLCGRKTKDGKGFIAHHHEPLGQPTVENGVCLCKACHAFITFMLRKVKSYPMSATRIILRTILTEKRKYIKRPQGYRRPSRKQLYLLTKLGFNNFQGSRAEASKLISDTLAKVAAKQG
jgi:hypothetical protein